MALMGTLTASWFETARRGRSKLVMPGLVPGIQVFVSLKKKDVDGRDEPGHDVSK
jgi:hypothetical protein